MATVTWSRKLCVGQVLLLAKLGKTDLISPRMTVANRNLYLRWYASSSTPTMSRQLQENPYLVLGIPTGSDYDTVKQAFLKAAMLHHPDRQTSSPASCTKEFIRVREAFEQIVAKDSNYNQGNGFDGGDSVSHEYWKLDQDLYPYFAQSTNEFLTFRMDDSTRHEVIRAYVTMAQGGKDRGGYWEMARQLAEREAAYNIIESSPDEKRRQAVRQLPTGRRELNRRKKKR